MTPEPHDENEDKTELDGKTLIDMIAGDEPPHVAFLRWVEQFDPELAKELREDKETDNK